MNARIQQIGECAIISSILFYVVYYFQWTLEFFIRTFGMVVVHLSIFHRKKLKSNWIRIELKVIIKAVRCSILRIG